jgi:hypothetical protein
MESISLNLYSLNDSIYSQPYGISMTDFAKNQNKATSNSTVLNLQVYSSGNKTLSSYRRHLSSSKHLIVADITIPQQIHIQYLDPITSYNILKCNYLKSQQYFVVMQCPNKQSYSLGCPINNRGQINASCPNTQIVPVCKVWNSNSFVESSECVVSSFSSQNTTCQCKLETFREYKLFTDDKIIDIPIHSFFIPYSPLQKAQINNVFISVSTFIFCVFLVACLTLRYKDINEIKQFEFQIAPVEDVSQVRKIRPFFENIFSNFPEFWKENRWLYLKELSYLCHISPCFAFVVFLRVLTFLFVSVVLCLFFYFDNGHC